MSVSNEPQAGTGQRAIVRKWLEDKRCGWLYATVDGKPRDDVFVVLSWIKGRRGDIQEGDVLRVYATRQDKLGRWQAVHCEVEES